MEMNTMTSLSEIFTELATTITNSSLCMPVSLPQELFTIVITMISLRGCRNGLKKKIHVSLKWQSKWNNTLHLV